MKNKKRVDRRVSIGNKNYACIVGQRCDFYIFYNEGVRGYWSRWLKGRDAATFWDECVGLDDKDLAKKLLEKYNTMLKK